jgi:hypothetical protein
LSAWTQKHRLNRHFAAFTSALANRVAAVRDNAATVRACACASPSGLPDFLATLLTEHSRWLAVQELDLVRT